MRTTRFLFVCVAVAAFLLAACGGTPPAAKPTATEQQQTSVVEPTLPPPTNTSPVTSAPAEPTQPQYASTCTTAPAGCEVPTVTMLDNKYCIDKVPYAIMSAPAGTTYETSDLDFQCVDQMHSDGTMRITCHSLSGKELWSYDLKVCNSACSAPQILQTGSGQCPAGYGYDPSNQCCAAPAPAGSDGCTVIRVDLGACSGS